MTTERIITAVTITTGEKNDGPQLETLIETLPPGKPFISEKGLPDSNDK